MPRKSKPPVPFKTTAAEVKRLADSTFKGVSPGKLKQTLTDANAVMAAVYRDSSATPESVKAALKLSPARFEAARAALLTLSQGGE